MQELQLTFGATQRAPVVETLAVGGRQLRLLLVPNRRARRYVLRLRADRAARVTIPRGGTAAEARRFAQRNVPWLEKELLRQAVSHPASRAWGLGSEVLLNGQPVRLEACANGEPGLVRFGDHELRVKNPAGDLRPEVEFYLWNLAARHLPSRVSELARLHQVTVRRVSVRNQKSRWGSCSRRGTVSLNWRLVQAPELVRDYIILHELAHFRHMNHSRAFWIEVARMCPDYRQAEAWLRKNSRLLR